MRAFPRNYLVDNATRLAEVVASSAAKRLAQHTPEDVERAFNAVSGLSDGSACDYSLSAIGPMYSLFFHGRRLHDALYHLHAAFKTLQPDSASGLLDYGTGTGAVVWGLALLHRNNWLPHRARPLSIDAYDSSSLMLQQAESLWRDLTSRSAFPELAKLVAVRWHHGSAAHLQIPVPYASRIVTAGYVLSDASTVSAEVNTLLKYAEECQGNKLALWSSPRKLDQERNRVMVVATRRGWTVQSVPAANQLEKASFWWKATTKNPSQGELQNLIARWANSGTKKRLAVRVEANHKKLSWICEKPRYPLLCLSR